MNIKSRYGPHSMLQGSLIINRNAPFCVLDCDAGMENILGYRPDEVVGRSIKFLCGPSTDTKEIHAAIKGSSMGQQSEIKALLYGRTGVSLNVMVRCHQDEQGCIQLTIGKIDNDDPLLLSSTEMYKSTETRQSHSPDKCSTECASLSTCKASLTPRSSDAFNLKLRYSIIPFVMTSVP